MLRMSTATQQLPSQVPMDVWLWFGIWSSMETRQSIPATRMGSPPSIAHAPGTHLYELLEMLFGGRRHIQLDELLLDGSRPRTTSYIQFAI